MAALMEDVIQADYDRANEWAFIECRHCSEYEGDFRDDLAADFAAHRLAYSEPRPVVGADVESLTKTIAECFSGMPERMAQQPVRAGEHHLGTLWTVAGNIASKVLATHSITLTEAGKIEGARRFLDSHTLGFVLANDERQEIARIMATFATHSPAPTEAGLFDRRPQLASVEAGPEPSLRQMVRFYYVEHGQPDPEADTEAYFDALSSTQGGAEG